MPIVKVHNLIIRIFVHEKTHYVRTDEPGAAGNKNVLHFYLVFIYV